MNKTLIGCAVALAVAPCAAQTPEQVEQIKQYCIKRHTNAEGTNWVYVEICVKEQIEAFKKVNGPSR